MVKTKKSSKFYLALVIFSLVGQIAWVMENMYFNVFIYKMFNASADAISGMVAASAIAATVTTLLIGALSDKVGKRKIFICGGYIAWGLSIWSFSLLRMDVLSGMFTDKFQDFVLSINETDIAVIKQITLNTTAEDLEKIARSMEDTLKNELFIKTIIGIGLVVFILVGLIVLNMKNKKK